MKTFRFLLAAALLFWGLKNTQAGPPLILFPTIQSDAMGLKLKDSMIWTKPSRDQPGVAVAFRKSFALSQKPSSAELSLFADARYILWVNGIYVERGPSRFQPNGPQYDVVRLTSHLRQGNNVMALLVVGNLSGGKVMKHPPGLTALLEVDGEEILRTDDSWKWSDSTKYRSITASWADLRDAVVDARVENGDWTQVDYDDRAWKSAEKIKGGDWGPLTQTLIPPLAEKPVPFSFKNNQKLPITLQAGGKLEFDATRIVQAYPVIEFEGEADTELSVEPFGVKYLAKSGRQTYFPIDSRGFSKGSITVKSGKVVITGFSLVERLYPYERLGSFKSNDAFLNQLWEMCTRSCEVLSEDSYVDCADRERVEWMDNTPPGFDMTRIAMAGPSVTGDPAQPLYSDPRLLAAMIRRTALTLQPEGWVKAHTCSDRYDIHAKMEDRACDWVEGVRLYYEATGDTKILREIWPAIVAQMNYFLERRTERGLVRARDWVVWGNPVGYLTGEGTTLNVFVQRALVDAAYLGNLIGENEASAKFSRAAEDLKKSINTVLWDEASGGYYSGYFTDTDMEENAKAKRTLKMPRTNNLTPQTLNSNLFALDRGIVPPERRERVVANMLAQQADRLGNDIMVYYYVMKQLYLLDKPERDLRVLAMMRLWWWPMAKAPWQCSWEGFGGGSKAHIYGMYPGYFLSTYVLGVRRDAPVAEKKLVIEPRLGDLTSVEGTVVTEFGFVPASWKKQADRLDFGFQVPEGVTAELILPAFGGKAQLVLDKAAIQSDPADVNHFKVQVKPGVHEGVLTFPLEPMALEREVLKDDFLGIAAVF